MVKFSGFKRIASLLAARSESKTEITFFQVKSLYNEAYEQKAQARLALRRFKRMEAAARQLEDAYRSQINIARRAA